MRELRPIRLLVAEDSPTCRELLVTLFQNAPGVQVVGTARDGAEAVRLAKRLKPDIVTMDIYMPNMDGYEATRQIMAETPCPIVMVSGRLENKESDLTFQALAAGALSILPKPSLSGDVYQQEALIKQVKLMADVKVIRRHWPESGRSNPAAVTPLPPAIHHQENGRVNLVAVAASTGGPGALVAILRELPATFPAPILIVQHVTIGFGEGLAAWLNEQTTLHVQVAQHAARPRAGEVLIAPDAYHMEVNHLGLISLKQALPHDNYCPSANTLFASVAAVYGATAVGIILTGMGDDGAQGLYTLHQTGAYTIAQDQATSVVFGMPDRAIQLNAVTDIQPIGTIAQTLKMLFSGQPNAGQQQ